MTTLPCEISPSHFVGKGVQWSALTIGQKQWQNQYIIMDDNNATKHLFLPYTQYTAIPHLICILQLVNVIINPLKGRGVNWLHFAI